MPNHTMIAAGIDLGGTKIEVQLFDQNWHMATRNRVPTPDTYSELVSAVANQIAWTEAQAGMVLPIGVAAAGLINPMTGLALTANLCASGKPFPADISQAAGRPIPYINDCRALALSEALFGTGNSQRIVMSLILGTGIGGGIAIDGALLTGSTQTGGEFGHMSAPAHLILEHGLPLVRCGCGRMGCIETYIAGPGLSRIAKTLTGNVLTPRQIADRKDADMRPVWRLWCDLTADHIRNLTLTLDPDLIILGGGLSQITGIIEDLEAAMRRAALGDFATPRIALASGGDTSGARGAAFVAWQKDQRNG